MGSLGSAGSWAVLVAAQAISKIDARETNCGGTLRPCFARRLAGLDAEVPVGATVLDFRAWRGAAVWREKPGARLDDALGVSSGRWSDRQQSEYGGDAEGAMGGE